MSAPRYQFHPLTLERWPDLERLFGSRGACAGCWCMWWRQTSKEFESCKGETNCGLLRQLTAGGEPPGILAFDGPTPVGWCSVAPREKFPRLERSRTMKRIDDKPVWSLVCLFVDKRYRKQGISVELARAAVDWAAGRGAKIVEAYPSVPGSGRTADVFIYTGLPQIFERAGFQVAARPTGKRWIMRRELGAQARTNTTLETS
jgi:GNAT superfamily N-acetyltransferase